MGCRKNLSALTPGERTAFINAVLALKTGVPSQLHPGDPTRFRYDDYVETHMNSMMLMNGTQRDPGWAHQHPAFFPWHREMLRRYEKDLQAIDPSITLPYWDWTQDQSNTALPWTDDFMGAMDPATDKVNSGPFKDGAWGKVVFDPNCPDDNTPYLRRALGRAAFQNDPCGAPNIASLPSASEVTSALGETPYDGSPWNRADSPSFRDRAEGWHGLGSIHNRVHLWVAGSMLPSTSPNDPIFFLHHCNIDRLLNLWQRQHPSEAYHPDPALGENGPLGHNLTDTMLFNDMGQPAPWTPVDATPATMWNAHQPPCDYWYDTDPPEVTLRTPSISFGGVPEGIGGVGVTTYRAVVFDVLSCAGATFQITADPTAPFTAPLGKTFPVGEAHGAPAAQARVWIGYTSTSAGAGAVGSVTVHCVETNQDFVVSISASTVPRPKSAVALVLDHSGSMIEDAGDGHPKVEKLKQAVSAFMAVMLPGDGLSMVRFDDTVQRLFNVTDVGPIAPVTPGSGRDLAQQVIASTELDPAGSTSIGGGVQEGRNALNAASASPPYAVKAMLVVTDGMENTPPKIADVAFSLDANTFAIGIGQPGNINVAALDALTQGHGGYLVVTGAITMDQSFRLTKYFLQALAGITNAQVVVDPQSELLWGAVHRIPFLLTEADQAVDVILLCPAASLVDFVLETPDGHLITPASATVEPALKFLRRSDLAFYRCGLPALHADPAGSRAGQWKALLRLGKGREQDRIAASAVVNGGVPYSLLVHAYSSLRMRASLVQKSHEPGARVELTATLTEYDVPVEGRARVWAEVTRPDGAQITVKLAEQEGGLFQGGFAASLTGLYVVRVRAAGVTMRGRPFEREQTLTASAVPGADTPPGGASGGGHGGGPCLCGLLRCILSNHGMQKVLADKGVDLEHIKKCVEECCPTPHERPTSKAALRGLSASVIEAIAGELIAQMPEARSLPHPPMQPMNDHSGMRLGPTKTMFELSPEDQKVGEEKRAELLAREQVAQIPEAKPLPHPPMPPSKEGDMKSGPTKTMFDLSPEDQKVGEEKRAELLARERAAQRKAERKEDKERAPKPAHDISSEDKSKK